jgi:hypothetical protein
MKKKLFALILSLFFITGIYAADGPQQVTDVEPTGTCVSPSPKAKTLVKLGHALDGHVFQCRNGSWVDNGMSFYPYISKGTNVMNFDVNNDGTIDVKILPATDLQRGIEIQENTDNPTVVPAATIDFIHFLNKKMYFMANGDSSPGRQLLNLFGGDYGDFTCTAGTCTLDNNSVTIGKISGSAGGSTSLFLNQAGGWTSPGVGVGTVTAVGNCTTGGNCFTGTAGDTLTFFHATLGSMTQVYDGNIMTFDKPVKTPSLTVDPANGYNGIVLDNNTIGLNNPPSFGQSMFYSYSSGVITDPISPHFYPGGKQDKVLLTTVASNTWTSGNCITIGTAPGTVVDALAPCGTGSGGGSNQRSFSISNPVNTRPYPLFKNGNTPYCVGYEEALVLGSNLTYQVNTATTLNSGTPTVVIPSHTLTISSGSVVTGSGSSSVGIPANAYVWAQPTATTGSPAELFIQLNLTQNTGSCSGLDTSPPTAPTVTASNPTATTCDITATGSTDNTAVTQYDCRDQSGSTTFTAANWDTAPQVGTTASFTASGLASATQYAFACKAGDAANNWSGLSNLNATCLTSSGASGVYSDGFNNCNAFTQTFGAWICGGTNTTTSTTGGYINQLTYTANTITNIQEYAGIQFGSDIGGVGGRIPHGVVLRSPNSSTGRRYIADMGDGNDSAAYICMATTTLVSGTYTVSDIGCCERTAADPFGINDSLGVDVTGTGDSTTFRIYRWLASQPEIDHAQWTDNLVCTITNTGTVTVASGWQEQGTSKVNPNSVSPTSADLDINTFIGIWNGITGNSSTVIFDNFVGGLW